MEISYKDTNLKHALMTNAVYFKANLFKYKSSDFAFYVYITMNTDSNFIHFDDNTCKYMC